jgi:hypothetical protein
MKTLKLLLLALFVSFGFSSCEKEDDLSLSDGIDDSYLVEVEMDGKSLILREGKDGYRSVATADKKALVNRCLRDASMIIAKETTLDKSFQVFIQNIADACPPGNDYVEGLYRVGEYPFAKQTETQEADGVVILYTDIAGVEWASNRGSADQTGSHFEIVSHELINHSKYKYETEAVFNCKLYTEDGKEMMLTNGRINSRSVRK